MYANRRKGGQSRQLKIVTKDYKKMEMTKDDWKLSHMLFMIKFLLCAAWPDGALM